MKEIELEEKDFQEIKDLAVTEWVGKSRRTINPDIKAMVSAFIMYCNARKLVVKDGKIFKKDE